jgi:hypothetical protein
MLLITNRVGGVKLKSGESAIKKSQNVDKLSRFTGLFFAAFDPIAVTRYSRRIVGRVKIA